MSRPPSAKAPKESPTSSSSVFLDLRSPTCGENLLTNWKDWRSFNKQPVPIIGLYRLGCSPRVAALSDGVLDAWWCWPAAAIDIPNRLREATSVANQKRAVASQVRCSAIGTVTELMTTYSSSMSAVVEQLVVAAEHDLTILLEGETGTGKTTMAKLIHQLSPRSQDRFLTVGCGGLPNDLIDSELFGHVKGAFTGADRSKVGKFEAAEGGTILLDEIDCLGMQQQTKLLRILETGEFEPLGSNDTRVAKARIIVAANVRLEKLIDQDRFRADLYYRLNQVKIEIPPLRQRRPDIVPLAMQFLQEVSDADTMVVDPVVLRPLKAYFWPGNIRELRNEIRRATLVAKGGRLTLQHLGSSIVRSARQSSVSAAQGLERVGLVNDVAQTEKNAIEEMLQRQNNNRAATARALGISRVTLYNKLRKYEIRIDDPSL